MEVIDTANLTVPTSRTTVATRMIGPAGAKESNRMQIVRDEQEPASLSVGAAAACAVGRGCSVQSAYGAQQALQVAERRVGKLGKSQMLLMIDVPTTQMVPGGPRAGRSCRQSLLMLQCGDQKKTRIVGRGSRKGWPWPEGENLAERPPGSQTNWLDEGTRLLG